MPVVRALMALRGVDFIAAITIVAEIGDLRRFPHPRELMGYLDSCRRSIQAGIRPTVDN